MIKIKLPKFKNPFKRLFKKKGQMSVNQMMVDDVIHNPEFAVQLKKVQAELLKSHLYTTTHGGRPNKDLVYLIDNGYLKGVTKFINEYRLVLMKVSALPDKYRKSIGAIGDKALSATVMELQKKEK